jgi:hypothetical protein
MKVAIKDAANWEVATELRNIAATAGGALKAADVVDAARDPDSPLHRFFEWHDGQAGENYRLIQAGMLIRRIKLHIVKSDDAARRIELTAVNAFSSLPSTRKNGGGYIDTSVAIVDAEAREELLERALLDIEAMRRRYTALTELQSALEIAARSLRKNRGRRVAQEAETDA